ncbi:hypothetical protein LCGC14_0289180 [marine sediment metagenome]|uniref:Uncharacterized protein n=1 Tax=marine sediment metagenome TaxID=412755 RepID=A0A0F9WF02_9ZZZZ
MTLNEMYEALANHLRDPMLRVLYPHQLLEFINSAARDAAGEGFFIALEDDESLSLVTSTYDYDVPSDFALIHDIWQETTAGGGVYDLWIPHNHWALRYNGSAPQIHFDDDLFSITNARVLKILGQARPSEYSLAQAGVNEVQRVSHDGTGGTFTLTFAGQTTSAIDWDATAAAVDTIMQALSNVTAVTITGGDLPVAIDIEFTNPGAQNIAEMTANAASLTGDTVGVTIATVTQGALAVAAGATSIDTGLEAFIRQRAIHYASTYMAVAAEGDEVALYERMAASALTASEAFIQAQRAHFGPRRYSRPVPSR